MGESTAISWCDHTFNTWWGCWKIADECKNCYADATAARYAPGFWGRTEPRRFFGEKHWREPLKWNERAIRDGVRRRVFVGSMMDWAEQHTDPVVNKQLDELRARLWMLIARCPGLDWLLLTKRIDDVATLLPWRDGSEPWRNVWLGVTAGTVESVRTKVPALRSIPAFVRFISCEPLLEMIPGFQWDAALRQDYSSSEIDWLIVGNESGPKRRPAQLEWIRAARDAALRHSVRFHFKQWVEQNGRKVHLPMLDGVQHAEFPR